MIVRSLVLGLVLATSGMAKEKSKSIHEHLTGQGYGDAGCGLGSSVFGEKPGMVQVVAAWLNSWGGQTFAITSGTSNCDADDDDETAAITRKVGNLVLANRHRMENDAAQGKGETIAALAAIGNCHNSLALGAEMQRHYKEVFFEGTTHQEITSRLLPLMKHRECLL